MENPNDLYSMEKGKILLYKYIDINGGLDLIDKQTFKFSNPKDFNDPFDLYEKLIDFSQYKFRPTQPMNREEKRRIEKASNKRKIMALTEEWRKIKENISISCFSRTYKNILMWSHYAQMHKGICIGFCVDRNILSNYGCFAQEVKYENEFKSIPYTSQKESLEPIMQFLTLKAKFWEYEKETRLIDLSYLDRKNDEYMKPGENKYMDFEKFAKIKEIYFGLRTSDKDKSKVKHLFSNHRDKPIFYEMTPQKNKFEIEKKEVSNTHR